MTFNWVSDWNCLGCVFFYRAITYIAISGWFSRFLRARGTFTLLFKKKLHHHPLHDIFMVSWGHCKVWGRERWRCYNLLLKWQGNELLICSMTITRMEATKKKRMDATKAFKITMECSWVYLRLEYRTWFHPSLVGSAPTTTHLRSQVLLY